MASSGFHSSLVPSFMSVIPLDRFPQRVEGQDLFFLNGLPNVHCLLMR